MALEMYQISMIITSITMVIALGGFVLYIAGKDIILALKRRFNRYGADVYVATDTRHIAHYYLTPKEGVFRIKGLPYVTNPDKILNMSDEARQNALKNFTKDEQKEIINYAKKRQKTIQERIEDEEKIRDKLEKELQALDDPSPLLQKNYRMKINHHNKIISKLKKVKNPKAANYYKDIRPAFYFVEGDPIPKDFYEYYSGRDAQMLDNLVSRAKTEAPQKMQEWDKMMKRQQLILYALAVAMGVLLFTMFKLVTALQDAGIVDKVI